MLNKKYRLTKNRYFQYIYKKGKKVYSKSLYIVYVPTKISPCKIGVVVSNKVGKAVKRNKVKRRIRAVLSQIIGQISNKYNYVVVAKPEIINNDFKQIESEINYAFKKGNFIE